MTQPHDRDLQPEIPPLWPSAELHRSLASRIAEISPFVDQLMSFIGRLMGKSPAEDQSYIDIEIAVREAIANAVIHGNHENPKKRVHVTCRCSFYREVFLTIRDEGRGFDPDSVRGATDPINLLLTHGRGILLMHALMDEVRFEANGTSVRMRKDLRAPAK